MAVKHYITLYIYIAHFKKDTENLEIQYFLQNGTELKEQFENEDKLNERYNLISNIKIGSSSGDSANEVYSTDEMVIGTWIDGKPLYRKTFIFTMAKTEIQKVLTLVLVI